MENEELSPQDALKAEMLLSMFSEMADGLESHIILSATFNLILQLLEQAPHQDVRNIVAGAMRDMAVELEKPVEEDDASAPEATR